MLHANQSKGRAVVEFLANHPIEGDDEAVEYLFPDEDILQIEEEPWTMYFDRASNQYGYEIGVLLIAPDDSHIPLAFKLRFKVSNNEIEYDASNRDWRVKEEKMKVYHQALDMLIPRFEKLTFTHLLRENNRFADALATLSSMVDISLGVKMRSIIIEQKYTPAYETIAVIDEVQDTNPWYYDIWNFLDKEAYPPGANAKDKRGIRRLAIQFII
ncbi:uncharacterized protein LOC114267516 [Camellia sinensis]|uniref:uncharacterized protein LOC114267516 n=1 Tax=Camellia sinensis TaxID=4442 RepID=UPI0010363D07|nr:uncharacterized protein LOC114267516 [Camellia sinensis]